MDNIWQEPLIGVVSNPKPVSIEVSRIGIGNTSQPTMKLVLIPNVMI